MDRRVAFIVVGTQKAGTSALDQYLRTNGDIGMAAVKEVHFFDTEENFTSGVDYDRYHSFFTDVPDGAVPGEVTPIYMYWREAPKRIHAYNPDMKLIAVLRNPIDRAFAHWTMESGRNADNLTFSEAVREESRRCREATPLQHRVYSYADRGFYTEQLHRIWRYFPRQRTLVIKYEDLKHSTAGTLQRVARFLGVREFEDVEYRSVFPTEYRSSMSTEDRQYLREKFHDEIRRLEALLGWDCSDWLELEQKGGS